VVEDHATQTMKLVVTQRTAWDGDVLIQPVVVEDQPQLNQPREKVGDVLLQAMPDGKRHVLVSAGPRAKLGLHKIRYAGVALGRWLRDQQAVNVGIDPVMLQGLGLEESLEAFCEGLLFGAVRFERLKSNVAARPQITVHVLSDGDEARLEARVHRVAAVMAGANLARLLAHEPPNVINPVTLAERAAELAAEAGLKFSVLGEKELTELGAGAILAVGLGSKTPSQMIILEYPGQGELRGTPPVVVVGKAITFDTGGYSLKPKDSIIGMKFDKCGGAAVLGIMRAVAALQPTVPVVGIVAAAENMINEKAYRPNDIITSLSGKTIEIMSTDAEGRMVLADTLTYAQEKYQPRALIDIATLTGGIVVAIGKVRAGLFANNEKLANALEESGERTYERLWRMPLDDEYFVLIKSDDADFRNSSKKRQAHPVVGALFLKQFVSPETNWAHVDIAGMATVDVELVPYKPAGATGFGVRLVMDYLLQLA